MDVENVVERDVFDVARSAPTNRYLLPSEIKEPEAPAAPLPAPKHVQLRGRVLLAEDNPVNQKFAVRVLEGAGDRKSVV